LNADLTSLDLMCSSMAQLHKSSRICFSQHLHSDHHDVWRNVSSHLWNNIRFDFDFDYHFFVKLMIMLVVLVEKFLVVSVRSLIHRIHVEWDQNLLTK
jgi:hypothetical protein